MNGNPKITEQPPNKFWCPQLLKALHSLGGSAEINEVRHKALSFFDVDKDVLEMTLKDGKSTRLFYRMAWARHCLVFTGYIGNEEHGVWTLTDKAKKEIPDILKFIDKDISEGIGGYPVPENCTTKTEEFIDNVMMLVNEGANRKKQEQDWLLEAASAKTGESADFLDEEAIENLSFDEDKKFYFEGGKNETFGYTYERSSVARKNCINHYGYKCQVCDFNFEQSYGDIGKDFIHVHHKIPFSEISGEYEVNPIKDLIPVCPNCHAMLHKGDPLFSVKEMKEILRENKKNK